MKTKNKKHLLFISFLFIGLFFSLAPLFDVFAAADCSAAGLTPGPGGVCFPTGTGLGDMSVFDLLARVMNWLLGIIGVLAVIAFIISGVQYLVSAGNEEMAETAKRNMKYAIIGLVVALAGLIIVNAVAGLTGAGGATNF